MEMVEDCSVLVDTVRRWSMVHSLVGRQIRLSLVIRGSHLLSRDANFKIPGSHPSVRWDDFKQAGLGKTTQQNPEPWNHHPLTLNHAITGMASLKRLEGIYPRPDRGRTHVGLFAAILCLNRLQFSLQATERILFES
jgi:hypothetical protein